MKDAKLLAELMLQLSIYFESDTDDIAEWLTTENAELYDCKPLQLIKDRLFINKVHKYVMETMT